jgi:hypothetical protein
MCQITGKYFEDTLIAKTAVRVADYPSESSWGIYKTYDGAAILFDCDVDHAKGELNNDS